jgi:hypothetical protein
MTVPLDPYRTALPCHPPCEWRKGAVLDERFLPALTLGGWVWLDAPLRQMSFRARFFNENTPDCSGQPFVFRDCPACGGALPAPLSDDWCIDGEDGG